MNNCSVDKTVVQYLQLTRKAPRSVRFAVWGNAFLTTLLSVHRRPVISSSPLLVAETLILLITPCSQRGIRVIQDLGECTSLTRGVCVSYLR